MNAMNSRDERREVGGTKNTPESLQVGSLHKPKQYQNRGIENGEGGS